MFYESKAAIVCMLYDPTTSVILLPFEHIHNGGAYLYEPLVWRQFWTAVQSVAHG